MSRPRSEPIPPAVQAVLRRPPRVTYALIAVLVGAYLLQRELGGVASPLEDIRLGANVPGMVFSGDWWRLITGNFLHGPWFHLAANIWGLWVLGSVLERLLDGRRFLLLYLASALAGAGASAAFSGALMGVGASTAIFGLLGAFAAVHVKPDLGLPPGFRQTRRWWLVVLGLNAFISFGVPMVDGPAHVGGFVGGAAVTWIMVSPSRPLLVPQRGPAIMGALGLLLGLFGFGLGQVALQADTFFEGPQGQRLATALARTDSATSANDLAWMLATDERAGPAAIAAAVAGAQRATALEPEVAAFHDTLAYAQFRGGATEAAIAAELRALMAGDTQRGFYATQLCTFAASAEPPPGVAFTVRLAGQRVAREGGAGVVIAQVKRGAQDLGCWVGHLGAEGVLVRDRRGMPLADGSRLEPLWQGAIELDLPADQWLWWRHDRSVEPVPYTVVGRSAAPGAEAP